MATAEVDMRNRRKSIATRLEGAPNFRDIGGYATKDGRTVAFGRVYRSGCFERLTEADIGTLTALGVRLVCDLRGEGERAVAPDSWPATTRIPVLHMNVNQGALVGDRAFAAMIAAEPTAAGARAALTKAYRSMPHAFAPHLASFFTSLMTPAQLPAVFHCHAGKDRTGFLSAMLLSALGVSRAAIIEDYALTAALQDTDALLDYVQRKYATRSDLQIGPEAFLAMIDAHPDYLLNAFDAIETEHGSIESYLAQAGSLDQDRRDRLRAALLI